MFELEIFHIKKGIFFFGKREEDKSEDLEVGGTLDLRGSTTKKTFAVFLPLDYTIIWNKIGMLKRKKHVLNLNYILYQEEKKFGKVKGFRLDWVGGAAPMTQFTEI